MIPTNITFKVLHNSTQRAGADRFLQLLRGVSSFFLLAPILVMLQLIPRFKGTTATSAREVTRVFVNQPLVPL